MSDIFEKENVTEALETGVGMFGKKIRGRSKDFFGLSAQAELSIARDRRITGAMMKGVIGQFGMQNMMKGDAFFDSAAKDIQQQLKEARDEAIRARAAGEMDSYRRALQRSAELERLAQSAAIALESNMGNFWIAIGVSAAIVLGVIVAGPAGGVAAGVVGVGAKAAVRSY